MDGGLMARMVLWPAAVLAATVAVMIVLASPAYPQTSMADLAADEEGNLLEPRPPKYEVTEDGTLVVEGDILVPCSEVGGPPDPIQTRNATPEVRSEIEKDRRESVRACQAAGFRTAAGSSASVSASSAGPALASEATAAGSASPSSSVSADARAVLPETGGPALLAPLAWAAALLLASGLLMLRVRR